MAMTVLASNLTNNIATSYPLLLFGTVPGPSSYATGGIALDFVTDFGSQVVPIAVFSYEQQATGTLTYDAKYDSTAKKLVIYDAGTTTEVSNTTDIDAFTFVVLGVSLT